MQQKRMTLKEFDKQILMPLILRGIKSGSLDNAIQSEDCQDIINDDPELREAVDKRMEVIKCNKKQ